MADDDGVLPTQDTSNTLRPMPLIPGATLELGDAIKGGKALLGLAIDVSRLARDMARIGSAVSKAYNAIGSSWTPHLLSIFEDMARQEAIAKRIEKAGWLPHYTSPIRELAAADPEANAAEIIDVHYRANWPAVRDAFEAHLQAYAIDDEAKATFREVLDCHDAGHFRVIARTLFPEIERVVRMELHAGSLATITSQDDLREIAEEMPMSGADPGGLFALSLFIRLEDHLYSPTRTTEAVAACSLDPVPNRHATLHGLVSYGTRQSSINALVMTDYIFQVVTAAKLYGISPDPARKAAKRAQNV